MNKILVTGGAGFIGSYISRQLIEDGYKVVIMDLTPPAPPYNWILGDVEDSYEYEFANVTNFASVMHIIKEHKIDGIINAAALTNVDLLKNRPRFSMKVNIMGAVNLLEAVRLFDIEKFVQLSSIAVYAPKQYEPIDEKHPTHLPDAGPSLYTYSSTKLAAEAFGMHYWQDHNINFIGLRLSGVYGFGMKYPLYALKPIVEGAVKGEEMVYETGGATKRDLVHIKDVARAVSTVLTKADMSFNNRIFNIAHGGELKDMFAIIDEVKRVIPEAKIEMGEGLTDYEATIQKTRGELSIEKAGKIFGYKPAYDLKKGIKDYIDMYCNCPYYSEEVVNKP